MAELMNVPEDHPFFGDLKAVWHAAASAKERMLPEIEKAGGTLTSGPWKLKSFTVSDDLSQADMVKAYVGGHDRYCPPGDYVSLKRRATPEEYEEQAHQTSEPEWITVMSDTPDEINDHAPAFVRAEGRVLVHGLGLGCVIAGLLAKKCSWCRGTGLWVDRDGDDGPCIDCHGSGDAVEHIDVVEIDRHVIDLTGRFYGDDPRVTIHNDDCATKRWPVGTHWNYVWHDIWSAISPENLTDDTKAEHGISYATLHRKFGGRCDAQDSWAFDVARKGRRDTDRELAQARRFRDSLDGATSNMARIHLLNERSRRQMGLPAKARYQYLLMNFSSGVLGAWQERLEETYGTDNSTAVLTGG